MTIEAEFQRRASELIDVGRILYRQGWVPATSGNFSARLSDGSVAITVSGRHKGRLTINDLMRVNAQGQSLDGRKPSAETALHLALYARFPKIKSVLHPHSPAAILASRLFKNEVILKDHELLKALEGIDTHEHRLVVPIFANDQDIPRLATKVNHYIDQDGAILAYIIAGHGFYTWGHSVADAMKSVEALEFMFECETRYYGVKHL